MSATTEDPCAGVPVSPAIYSDRQRVNFLGGWNGWTAEIRQLIDRDIEAHRTKWKDDETQGCLDCGTPLVPCDCRDGCPGGMCAVCPREALAVEQGGVP